jgi:hypothetical protein
LQRGRVGKQIDVSKEPHEADRCSHRNAPT